MPVTLTPLQVIPVQLLLHGSPIPCQVEKELLHPEMLVLKDHAALIEARAEATGGGEGGMGGGLGGGGIGGGGGEGGGGLGGTAEQHLYV